MLFEQVFNRKLQVFVSYSLAGTMLTAAACSSTPDFYLDPTGVPAPAEEPEATANVIRTIPYVRPELRPTTAIPTPTPQPTPIVTRSVIRDIGSWQDMLWRAFADMRWQQSFTVNSTLYWPVVDESGESEDVLVEITGEFELVPSVITDIFRVLDRPDDMTPEFHLFFSYPGPDSLESVQAEMAAHQGRLITDTTVNQMQTYASYVAWRDDPNLERPYPSVGMVVSLAVSGGRVIGDDAPFNWPEFEVDAVPPPEDVELDGESFKLFAAHRMNDQGGVEEWQVWVSEDGLPRRIEFSMENQDPELSVHSAVCEITYTGEDLRSMRRQFVIPR